MKLPRRFVFYGHANAYSGWLYRPEHLNLSSGASAALSPAGGEVEASQKRQRFPPYLTVGAARATARGRFDKRRDALAASRGKCSEDELTSTTDCTVEIEDIRLDEARFRVKHLRAGLVSKSPEVGKESPVRLARDTFLKGVSIDGYELAVSIDTKTFSEHDTFDKALKHLKRTAPVFEQHDRLIYTTVATRLEWVDRAHPDASIDGNMLKVANFGRIYFGELFIEDSTRRLTLMRAHLGSPIGGQIGFGNVGTNGSWYPPT
jgi:hypothetical protein